MNTMVWQKQINGIWNLYKDWKTQSRGFTNNEAS